jgi:hypothetical protein
METLVQPEQRPHSFCLHPQAASTGYPGSGPWSTVLPSAGIKFEPQWDPLYMAALSAYFNSRSIANFIWWPWNSDGGDTGGIPANDSYFWQQSSQVHRVLGNNGVPWTDVSPAAAFCARTWDSFSGCPPIAKFSCF